MRISDWSSDGCSSVFVLVQDNHVRRRVAQRCCVLVGAFRKHGVEQRHLVPHLSQHRGNLDGGERRIRLAAFPLLLVEAEEIGVGELDSEHVTGRFPAARHWLRSEEHTSELQSLMRISYAVFCLKKKKKRKTKTQN